MAKKTSPWSVKGIGQDTRDIARKAASDSGLTIGAWIDQAILNDATGEASAAENPDNGPAPEAFEVDPGGSAADAAVDNTPSIENAGSAAVLDQAIDILEDELAGAEARLDDNMRPMVLALRDLASRMVAAERRQAANDEALFVPASEPEPDTPDGITTEVAEHDLELLRSDFPVEAFDPEDFGPQAFESPGEPDGQAQSGMPQEPVVPKSDPSTWPEPVAPTWDLGDAIDPAELGPPVPAARSERQETGSRDSRGEQASPDVPPWVARMQGDVGIDDVEDPDVDDELDDLLDDLRTPTGPSDRDTFDEDEAPDPEFEAFLAAKRREAESTQIAGYRTITETPPRRRYTGLVAGLVFFIFVGACAGTWLFADRIGVGPQKAALIERLPGLVESARKSVVDGWHYLQDAGAEGWDQARIKYEELTGSRDNAGSDIDVAGKAASDKAAPDKGSNIAESQPPATSSSETGRPAPDVAAKAPDNPEARETEPDEKKTLAIVKPDGPVLSSEEIARRLGQEPIPPAPEKDSSGTDQPERNDVKPMVPSIPPVPATTGKPERPDQTPAMTSQQGGSDAPVDQAWIDNARRQAQSGDARSQHDLGVLYATGKGVARDMTEAATWFREAAIQGVANAQYNLGVLYEQGDGVSRDEVRALLWYHSAAEQGHPLAQYNLGIFHAEGRGVPLNFGEAARWFRRAADQDVDKALYNLAIMTEEGLGVTPDAEEARQLFERAAALGNRDAQIHLEASSDGSYSPPKMAGPASTQSEQGIGPSAIAAVQEGLAERGLYTGRIDGLAGPKTREAIKAYQRANGFEPSGIPSSELLAHILSRDPG